MPHAASVRRVGLELLVVAALGVRPASAQISLAGDWNGPFFEDALERAAGPELGDYLGLPITAAARLYADAWDASSLTLQEHQCRPHSSPYTMRGPLNVRIWEDKDPDTQNVVAIKMFVATFAQTRTIYMDGRPHPSEHAAHTWQGFSTGKWQGNTLTVTTTHIKQYFTRRNGLPQSDRARLTEHFIRHGSYITHVSILDDPPYLSEPLVKTQTFVLNPNAQQGTYQTHLSCQPDEEIAGRPKGYVPHHLPGTNMFVREFAAKYGIPFEATRGGADTMYPEYRTASSGNEGAAGRDNRTRPDSKGGAPSRAQEGGIAERGPLESVHVQGDVYMLVGAGGNITVQLGPQGVLVVDTGAPETSDKILAAVRRLSDKPIRYIINTSADADHASGNEKIAKAGQAIPARELLDQGAVIVAHENVLNRMSAPTGSQAPTPVGAWPTATYFVPEKDLYFNGEALQILHQPAAHTDGDSVVFFRKSDVVSAGDIFVTDGYPAIDVRKGGSVNGVIDGLNRLLDLTIAGEKEEGGTMIVPGHGRVCDEADLSEYRDMVTIVRDRVQDLVKKGMTLEQVKAARPTQDFDPRYGATTGSWTTDMFVEAVYRTLSVKK